MKRPKLTAEKRTVLGKKVKKLRKEGLLPANVYGKDLKSTAVSVKLKEFEAIFQEVGETGLIDVVLDGQNRPVLVKNLQKDHVSKKPLHADFYQVNLKEKVKTMVPLEITGEPKAVTEKIGTIIQPLSEIEVEALPEDLPEHIEVNVEALAAVGEQITVGQLSVPTGVTVLTDPGQIVVKIDELISKEAQEQAAQEAAAAEAAKEGEEQATEGAEAKEEDKKEAAGEEKPKETPEAKPEEK